MNAAMKILELNVQIIQVAAFIWMVFEVRLLRHMFEQHVATYHAENGGKKNGKDNEPAI